MRYGEMLREAGYRFEIRYNDDIISSLTMALPPVQKNFREPSRSSVIKTQGGATVLDFGPDNKTITLNGVISKNVAYYVDKRDINDSASAITSEGGIENQEINGAKLLQVFKERILRYRENLSSLINNPNPDYSKVSVRFYDYWDDEYWIVNLDYIEWSENQSQPIWVNFNIGMTTLERFIDLTLNASTVTKKKAKDRIKTKTVTQQSLMNKIKAIINQIKATVYQIKRTVQRYARLVRQFIQDIETLINDIDKIVQAFTSTVTIPLDMVTSAINTINAMITVLRTMPYRASAQILLSLHRLKNSLNGLIANLSTKPDRIKKFGALKGIGMQTRRGAYEGEIGNTSQGEYTIESILRDGGGSRIIRKGLTLQSIASRAFGDASLYPLIMIENNISITNVIVGQVVYIPSNDPRARDVYLTDIKFDKTGLDTTGTGDIGIINGIENVIANIQRRITILQGSYYRFPDLGIENVIGRPSSEFLRKIVRINILEAVLSDPRISNVVEIKFLEDESVYNMSIKIKLLNGETPEILL